MKKTMLLILAIANSQFTWADNQASHQPSSHAPIGIMGDHTHNQGELMFSYRYMNMSMSGLRSGTNDVATDESLLDFMLVPVEMDMKMHMFGAMYAPSDRLTLMAMINYLNNDMIIQSRMGNQFSTSSDGLGDSKLSALIKLNKWNNNSLHANVGLSIPTGSINPTDVTPMGPNSLLPYPMRLGSGTYDMNLGVTWNQYNENYSLGAQLMGTIRTGENDHDYRLGNETKINFWVAKPLTNAWSISGRLEAKNKQSIKGSDPRLMMMANLTPTANANFSGGQLIQFSMGLNYVSNSDNWTNGHRLAFEFNQPIRQDLDGTQMKLDNSFSVGWQKAF